MVRSLLMAAVVCVFNIATAQKPAVWIYTDMTDPKLPGNNHMGTINDPDDVSAMAAYLLMGNMFDTRGIVVGSTHRKEHQNTPDQADWANHFWGEAYANDVIGLNKNIGGFPSTVNFIQSCIKETGERFNPDNKYENLNAYNTVEALLEESMESSEVINVLCWGSLTEPAILVKHCITNGRTDVLQKLRFIAHWTNSSWHQGSMEEPENVANCREDAAACAFLKIMALNGYIKYYECGAIGQHGIVSGSPKGDEYWAQFKESTLGKIFAEGKYVNDCVDDSDCATYWVLLGDWGVSLKEISSNGTNNPNVEKKNEADFKEWAPLIRQEILRRSNASIIK